MTSNGPIGDRIRAARLGRGMTQADLARLAGVTPASANHWEVGGATPRRPVLAKIAKALGETEAFLRTGRTAAKPPRTAAKIIAAAAAEIAALNGVPISRVKIDWRID